MKTTLIASALVAYVSAHGLIRSIQGANGVEMPGLSVQDGIPRDCSSNRCGSQADTAIIRDREINSGEASPLGRTQGQGPVDAAAAIATFMGAGAGAAGNSSAGASGNSSQGASDAQIAEDTRLDPDPERRRRRRRRQLGGLRGFLGLGQDGGNGDAGDNAATGQIGDVENLVSQTAGNGASEGLPTCADDGTVAMTFYQINADGAGPLSAEIDPTSGGTDASAFEQAEVTEDIPGFLSLSGNSMTEMPITVQMPNGMTCEGSVGGADNVCIVRVQNNAIAGPFGGAAAFTQSNAARKRAVEYRLKKRAAMRFDA